MDFIISVKLSIRVAPSIWSQEWKEVEQIGLGEEFSDVWATYTRALKEAHIRITERDDELVWKNPPMGFIPQS
jgi:hypothetical protein